MQEAIRTVLAGFPPSWRLLDGVRQGRPQLRADLVLVTDRAVLVFARERGAADSAATSLADFHSHCRDLPVIPVVFLQGERATAQDPLPLPGAAPPIACTRLLLPGLLARVAAFPPVPGSDPARWEEASYRPVPALLAAAAGLYARHDVTAITLASSGRGTLDQARQAIAEVVAGGTSTGRKQLVMVTGGPGTGKSLCGLDLAFAPGAAAAFLTGNPALLHVLRAALVRDAGGRLPAPAARQRVHAVIQPLHAFRDHYAPGGTPPDRLLVIDEAQRCWTAEYAIRKSLNKPVRLCRSEPGHILDAMNRIEGPCTVVCLIGGGQEIHAGEGGIAAWGEALVDHPGWHAVAPPGVLASEDPRQRLPPLPGLRLDPRLHLGEPIRSFAAPDHVAWVDAVLRNDPVRAALLAAGGGAPRLVRSLPALREALVAAGPRAGLVASSGGKRLRAEGLGGLLWHQDEDAVARWFLDDWPDIRGSDALEVAATEFGIQGLELDRVGLCWDLDLCRTADGRTWLPQAFRATRWTSLSGDALVNRVNAYRVLLTRARRETVIWVPRGDERDATRCPARYQAIADYLGACGARPLDAARPPAAQPRQKVLV